MRHIYFSIAFFVLLCAGSIPILAQQITVKSISTLQPVPDVAVYSFGKSFSTLTNKQGEAVLKGFEANDTVYFQHPSFYKEKITLQALEENGYEMLLVDKVIQLEETVVSVSKTEEKVKNVPNKVDIIRPSEILFNNAQTPADALAATGNVFVQQSQMGGGSPVLRGFEANKVLIVVDGVRMNNAIYRSGHLQDVITLDEAVLARTEVVYGPGSLIYGSDALGGVMHFYTKDPVLADTSDRFVTTGSAYARYGSANFEKTVHGDISLGTQNFGSLTSITFSDFDDSRVGHRQNPFYEDFGKRYKYADRINGQDVEVENDDPLIQKFTGYRQVDLLQKFLVPVNDFADITLNFQMSTSSNIPRYDKLRETSEVEVTDTIGTEVLADTIIYIDTTYTTDRLKYAQWAYGPQTRYFASTRIDFKEPNKAFNSGSIVAAYQKVFQERISRRFGRDERTNRVEELDIVSLNADFNKTLRSGDYLQYGFEGVWNNVKSTATSTNIVTGEQNPASTRYPDGGSVMNQYSAYLKYNINLFERVNLSTGFRYSYINLVSRYDDTDFFEFEFDEVKLNTSAFSGSIGISANPGKGWHLNFLGSSGYRAPNVDDIGKVFNPSPGQVVVPNENLKPEYVYNVEAGITKTIKNRIEIGVVGYNTVIKNAILRRESDLNGQEYIVYEGDTNRVFAKVNVGTAFIRGFTVNVAADITQRFSIKSDLSFTYGRDVTNDEPLGHIPPLFGQTSLTYKQGRFRATGLVRYQGWKDAEDFSPSGSDNLPDATEEGSPAWYTINLRAAYQFNRYFRLQFAADNILDMHYRPFSSGVSAFGRNFIVTARVTF